MSAGELTGWSVLRASIGAYRRPMGVAALLLMGHQTGEALVPVLIGVVIDRAVGEGDLWALVGWLGVLGVNFAMLSTCYRWGARYSWRADVLADQRLRLLIADRVLDPRGGADAGRLPGALTNIAVSDAKRVGIVNFALPLGLGALAAMAVATVMLLRISLPLGLLILLGTPPLLYLVHLLGKPLEKRSGAEQERAARASGVAADLVAGIRVLKGIGAEPAAVRRYIGTSREALDATLRATGAQAWYQGAVVAANGLFLALVALVGGRLALAGQISVGELVAAVGLAQFLITPLEMFGWVNGRLAQGRASAARIAEVLNTPPAVTGGSRPVPKAPAGELRLRGVRLGPLREVNLTVAPGELLGIVTPEPAEATALLRCLARETDPESGAVELDGVPLTEYAPADARSLVVVAAHDAALFAGTLLENVTAGLRPVTGESRPAPAAPPAEDAGAVRVADARVDQVVAAMAAAQVDQVAAVLPEGQHTELAEQGSSLSGGQRQRVALARAFATNASVLVLHDPTTAVDPATEARIAAGLREIRQGRTTVLLTTSPALLAVTDRVVLLARGRIAAEGSHAELRRTNDRYRRLVLA